MVGETPVQFDYFASGQRKRMIDASGTTDLLYDPLGRLQSKAAPAGKITYLYNDTAPRRTLTVSTANQNGTARTGLGATTVVYRWNSLNQLASATDTGLATTQYGFDVRGNLESVLYPAGANGLETHYTYDSRNRLRDMTVGSAAMARYLYDVLPDGKRSRATESGSAVNATGNRTVDYAYDNINRLTKESIAGDEGGKNGDLAYTLDNVGNRTWYKAVPFGTFGSSATFDENDRLNPASNFDKNGNTLVSGRATFQYDFQNRLKARTSGTAVQLVYDGDGNLVSRTVGGVTTWYLVEDRNPTGYPQVLEEVAADRNQVMKRYTWGLALISQEDSAISYSGLDGHGNVRLLLDSAGNARADRYVYDAYGRLIRSAGTTPNVYRYCGERLDPDLGLYYLRARYYQPQTGRFWTMDTFQGRGQDPLSLHKYLYCHSDPVNFTDPTGHFEGLGGLMASSTIGCAIGMWGSIAANHALGKAQTYSSILMGGALGAVLGPLSAEYAWFGVGVGAVSVASSGTLVWEVFKNPNSTYFQKVEASALLVASVAGTAVGVKYARIAKTPQVEASSALPTTKRLFRVVTENEVKQMRTTGEFESPPNGSTPDGIPGKWFYGTRAEAEAFAKIHADENPTIVATEVTQDALTQVFPGIDGGKTGYFVHLADLLGKTIEWLPYP